jgi:hypothetical protein
MIKDYASLRAAVQDYLQRDDLVDHIPYFIQSAETQMNKMRVRHMETALSTTISSGVVALPSSYLALKFAYISDSNPTVKLNRVSAEQLYKEWPLRSSTGVPQMIAREATNFIFGPYPDSGYAIKGIYYAKPAALSADTDVNWAITNYPLFMLYAALAGAELFLRNDNRMPIWKALLADNERIIEKDERGEAFSGSVLRSRPS